MIQPLINRIPSIINRITKPSIKTRKTRIEILWSTMGGVMFSMLPRLFNSGSSDSYYFSLERWWKYFDRYTAEFLFGFFFTWILIWSIKKYKSN